MFRGECLVWEGCGWVPPIFDPSHVVFRPSAPGSRGAIIWGTDCIFPREALWETSNPGLFALATLLEISHFGALIDCRTAASGAVAFNTTPLFGPALTPSSFHNAGRSTSTGFSLHFAYISVKTVVPVA